MKRKWLYGILAVVLIMSLLVGCSGGKQQPASKTNEQQSGNSDKAGQTVDNDQQNTAPKSQTLLLYTYIDINAVPTKDQPLSPLVPTFKEIIKKFEEANPGVKVKVEVVPWDQLDSKVVMTNQAGNPPDVTFLSSQKLASILNAGALMPLDKYIEAELANDMSDFAPVEIAATTSKLDGKKYAFLQGIHSRLLWYRKDILPKAPETWQDVIAMSQQYANPSKGLWGFGFWAARHYGAMEVCLGPFIWSAGGKIANDDGSAAWNTSQVMEAIQFESDLINKYKVSPKDLVTIADYGDVASSFRAGNYLMYIDGSYALPTIQQSQLWKDGKIGWAPIPKKDVQAHSYNFANGWALGIPAKSKNPDLAWKFIKFFETPEIQIMNAKAEGSMPTRMSTWENEAFKEPVYQFIAQNLKENGHPMDPLVYYQEGLDALAVAAQDYLLHPDKDLKKILDDSANNFNKKYYNK